MSELRGDSAAGPPVYPENNPKHLMGIKKVPLLSVLPTSGLIYEAVVMRYGAYYAPKADGTFGYGPFNWRSAEVVASIYADAAMRHIMAYWDGEANAKDSRLPHLGHAKACLGILIDATETDNLIDDRPPPGSSPQLLERYILEDNPIAGDG